MLVLIVTRLRPRNPNHLRCSPGLVGLTVTTSNPGFASAGMDLGGSGIAQAVSAFARSRFSGSGFGPCAHVPVIVFPSADILPSYLPWMKSIEYFKTPSSNEAE